MMNRWIERTKERKKRKKEKETQKERNIKKYKERSSRKRRKERIIVQHAIKKNKQVIKEDLTKFDKIRQNLMT